MYNSTNQSYNSFVHFSGYLLQKKYPNLLVFSFFAILSHPVNKKCFYDGKSKKHITVYTICVNHFNIREV